MGELSKLYEERADQELWRAAAHSGHCCCLCDPWCSDEIFQNMLSIVAQVSSVQFKWVNNVALEISQAGFFFPLSPSYFMIVKKVETRILQVNIMIL